jgi:hypothetical protein
MRKVIGAALFLSMLFPIPSLAAEWIAWQKISAVGGNAKWEPLEVLKSRKSCEAYSDKHLAGLAKKYKEREFDTTHIEKVMYLSVRKPGNTSEFLTFEFQCWPTGVNPH